MVSAAAEGDDRVSRGSEFAREDSPDTPERGSWCLQPLHLGSCEEEDEQVQFPGDFMDRHD